MPIFTVTDPQGRTLTLEGAKPPTEEELDNIFSEYFGTPVEAEGSVLGQAGEFAKAIPRGFASGFLSSAEGIGELADATTNFFGLENAIDSGEENELVNFAREGRKSLNQSFLAPGEQYRDAWTTKVGEGIGSLATFLTPGVLARVAGVSGKALKGAEFTGAVGLGAGAGAGDQAQRIQAARDAGINVDQATEDQAIFAGTAIGLTELATPMRLFGNIRKVADDAVKKDVIDRIKSAAATGSIEAIQEASAGVAQDLVEQGLYNENIQVADSLLDDLTVGGAVGALADLVVTSAAGRRSNISTNAEMDKDADQAGKEVRDQVEFDEELAENERVRSEALTRADQAIEQLALETQADQDLAALEQRKLEIAAIEEADIRRQEIERRDPSAIRKPPPGVNYTDEIARVMGPYFPRSGKFEMREVPNPGGAQLFQVFESGSEKNFGTPVRKNDALALVDGLNTKVVDKNIREQATDAMDMAPQTYDKDQADKLRVIHSRVVQPEANTFTSTAINEAAGTTYLAKDSDGNLITFPETSTFEEIIELTGRSSLNQSELPASVRLNNDRERRGLAPSDTFTSEEAASILTPEQMDKLIGIQVKARTESESYTVGRNKKGEPVVTSTDGVTSTFRPQNQRERAQSIKEGINPDAKVKFKSLADARYFANTQNAAIGTGPVPRGLVDLEGGKAASEIQKLLDNKNIDAKTNSNDIKAIAKAFVGKRDLSKMTLAERELFYFKLRALPRFEQPTKLPKNFFTPKPFTREQFRSVKQAVQDFNDASVERIQQASGLIDQSPLTQKKIEKLRQELVDQSVIDENGKVLTPSPQPDPEPVLEVAPDPDPIITPATPTPTGAQKFLQDSESSALDKQADLDAGFKVNKANKTVDTIASKSDQDIITQDNIDGNVRPPVVKRAEQGLPENEYSSFETPVMTRGDRFIFNVADKFIGLKKIEEAINKARVALGQEPIAALESAYIGEESIPGKIGETARVFQREEVQPLVDELAAANTQKSTQEAIKELDDFLILRHALERNKRISQINDRIPDGGAGSIVVDGEEVRLTNQYVTDRMRDQYDLKWNDKTGEWSGGNQRARVLGKLASKVDSIIQKTIDTNTEGGLYSQEDKNLLSGFYKYYVPLKGKEIEDDFSSQFLSPTSGSSGKVSIEGAETRRALGRESAAESPLATVISDRERAIARSAKNKEFGQKLYALAKNNPNPNSWEVYDQDNPKYTRMLESVYTYLPTGERVQKIPPGLPESERRLYVKKVVMREGQSLPREMFGVKINGEQVAIDIKDDNLRKALLNLDASNSSKIIQSLGAVNRFLSAVNTSFNPEFVVGNFARDIQTAVYNIIGEQSMPEGKAMDTRIVGKVIKDTLPSIRAFYRGFRNSDKQTNEQRKDYEEYITAGAKADWFHSRPPEQQKATIDSMIEMAKGTYKGKAKEARDTILNLVEDSNAAVENGVRFASFKAARDEFIANGIPRDEAIAKAATLAKNLTVNFNRSGDQGQLLNSLYLFFNASVQGTMNFARGLNVFDPRASRVKQGMVASMVGSGALLSALAEAMSDEDDNGESFYANIPNYVKERNIVIMKDNGKDYYTIPLPYGYNAFHVLGANIQEMMSGMKSPEEAATLVTKALLGSFNPIGISESKDFLTMLAKTGFPTIGQPVLEILSNENFFGAPVYSEQVPYGVEQPLSQLAKQSTFEGFKNAAKIMNGLTGGNESVPGALDFSPDKIQHLFNYALGGAGATGLRTVEAFRKLANEEDISVNDIPFYRRIAGEVDHRTSQTDFYERRTRVLQRENQLDVIQDRQDFLDYLEENQPFISMAPMVRATDKEIRLVNKRLRELRGMANENPSAAKRYAEEEEELQAMKKAAYDRFNRKYSEIVGRTE
jgi:hypothetical protein|tara:strand:+ start:9943 stop:15582 length:5640 start_codon:yes stop_codon:yes gene_type:complete